MTSAVSAPDVAARRLLWAMLAATVVQQIDRNIINVMLEPLRQEFHLRDAQLGLLAGTMFSVSYMIAGLPIGRYADRANRRNLLACLLGLWSVLTALCGFCQTFVLLALCRVGVGAAESGTQPTAMSMLSDVYPPERRGAIGGAIYGSAMFGGFISYLGGGYIAAHLGWRAAFLVAGLPGILLTLYFFRAVEEPARHLGDAESDHAMSTPFLQDVRHLLFHPILGPLYIAATICVLVASAISTWGISLMMRVHGLSLAQAGLVLALATTLFGMVGTPLAGLLADRLALRRPSNALRIPAVSAAACGAGAWGFANGPSPLSAIAGLCLMGVAAQAHAGVVIGTISKLAPAHSRTLGLALFSVVGSVLGLAVGPWLVGQLSDTSSALQPLREAMSAVAPLSLVAVALFLLAARNLDRT
jgi:MFS family permease